MNMFSFNFFFLVISFFFSLVKVLYYKKGTYREDNYNRINLFNSKKSIKYKKFLYLTTTFSIINKITIESLINKRALKYTYLYKSFINQLGKENYGLVETRDRSSVPKMLIKTFPKYLT